VAIEVWPEIIDEVNILRATRIAMEAVCRRLYRDKTIVVVDGVRLDWRGGEMVVEERADSRYFSVASASILAKVHRDHLMTKLAERYARWGWERNMGYPTSEHRRALDMHGRSHLHRKTFGWRPVLPCEERQPPRKDSLGDGHQPGQGSAGSGKAGPEGEDRAGDS
jgi:ribonuclease HII